MSRPPSTSAPRVRSTRALDVFAAACAVAAALLLLWPASRDVVETASAREPASLADSSPAPASATRASEPGMAIDAGLASTLASAERDSLLGVVVNGNVFSPTRRAPRIGFSAPGQPRTGLDVPPEGDTASAAATEDSLPSLSGIVAINGERRALMQLAADDGAPKLYRVNDSHAGYRIVQIGRDHVVLTSRAGRRIVRLPQRATPDSLENPP